MLYRFHIYDILEKAYLEEPKPEQLSGAGGGHGVCGGNAAVLVLVMVLTVFIKTGRNVHSKKKKSII